MLQNVLNNSFYEGLLQEIVCIAHKGYWHPSPYLKENLPFLSPPILIPIPQHFLPYLNI